MLSGSPDGAVGNLNFGPEGKIRVYFLGSAQFTNFFWSPSVQMSVVKTLGKVANAVFMCPS